MYGGFSDWRLPTTNTTASSNCGDNLNPGGGFAQQNFGFNCTGSEMGHRMWPPPPTGPYLLLRNIRVSEG